MSERGGKNPHSLKVVCSGKITLIVKFLCVYIRVGAKNWARIRQTICGGLEFIAPRVVGRFVYNHWVMLNLTLNCRDQKAIFGIVFRRLNLNGIFAYKLKLYYVSVIYWLFLSGFLTNVRDL